MIKRIFKSTRLTRRERIIAGSCCSQMVTTLEKKLNEGALSDSDIPVLVELRDLVKKLESTK